MDDASYINEAEQVFLDIEDELENYDWDLESDNCLLYTSPSPRDRQKSRMPSSA